MENVAATRRGIAASLGFAGVSRGSIDQWGDRQAKAEPCGSGGEEKREGKKEADGNPGMEKRVIGTWVTK